MAAPAIPTPGKTSAASVNLAYVLDKEAVEIREHGLAGADGRTDRFGVCFSGGGIRAACVALGVSQSLARHGLFRQVQYISAISGGGYMLGAFAAWIKRAPRGFAEVNEALARSADPAMPVSAAGNGDDNSAYPRFLEPDFIRNLRRYSSYLTPRLGILSGDALALASTYLRNLLLNLTMMFSAVFALMLVAQTAAPSRLWAHPLGVYCLLILGVAIALCFVAAVILISREIQTIRNASGTGSALGTTAAFILAFTGFTLLWILTPSLYALQYGLWIALASTGVLGLVGIGLTWWGVTDSRVKPVYPVTFGILASAWIIAGLFAASISVLFFKHLAFPGIVFVGGGYVIFGLPAILVSFPLVSYLFIGILGNQLPDAEREWLARFAGYFLAGAACVGIVAAVALDGAAWMDWLICAIRAWGWKGAAAAILPGGWLYVTASGVLLGRSSRTGDRKPAYSYTNFIVAIAPFIFILGVLVVVSWGANRLVQSTGVIQSIVATPAATHAPPPPAKKDAWDALKLERQKPATPFYRGEFDLNSFKSTWHYPWYWPMVLYVLLTVGFAGLSLLLAKRLDINEFSMHLFYRNRLVRAFPGASNPHRNANIFTNFSLSDDFPLRSLVKNPKYAEGVDREVIKNPYDGPYPIWGTALNMNHGQDLSWQQRKAASFIYSPLFCGWDYSGDMDAPVDLIRRELPDQKAGEGGIAPYGFRSTTTYGGVGGQPVIGTAMAASGAAASPNMGYHTRAGVAALLALFNVRLGWWTGNPRNNNTYCEYAPGAGYLLKELLGSADAEDRYVYLSDGGHFENLGLYELVRRRMRLIVASDADCDADFSFSDLGNAIERCRRDFGVHIELSASDDMRAVLNDYLEEDDQRLFRRQHYALGTITYPRLPGELEKTIGYLIYVKSSLTGDEPADVLAMRADYPDFPHDSTGNQFFNESLFESYRALGEHMMTSALRQIRDAERDPSIPESQIDRYAELNEVFEAMSIQYPI